MRYTDPTGHRRRSHSILITLILLMVPMSSCALPIHEHYFEPATPEGQVIRANCSGRVGPPTNVLLSLGEHPFTVSAHRGDGNFSSRLGHNISSSIVLIQFSVWLKQGESLSIDPTLTQAQDTKGSPLRLMEPFFLLETYIQPEDPNTSKKVSSPVPKLSSTNISMTAPSAYKNTIVQVYVGVEVGSADEFSVKLPSVFLSGAEFKFPAIRYEEKNGVFGYPIINC